MNEDIIISVKNLTKDYGKNRGVFDISFDIYSLVQLLVLAARSATEEWELD